MFIGRLSSSFLLLAAGCMVRDLWLGKAPEYAKGAFLLVAGIGAVSVYAQFIIPKTGMRVKQFKPRSRIVRTCLFTCNILAFGCVVFFIVAERQLSHPMLVFLVGAAVWSCVELVLLYPEIRRSRRDQRRNADLAAEEWERLEREGGEKPLQGVSDRRTSADL